MNNRVSNEIEVRYGPGGGVWVDGARVPGVILTDSIYVRPESDVLTTVTLTLAAESATVRQAGPISYALQTSMDNRAD